MPAILTAVYPDRATAESAANELRQGAPMEIAATVDVETDPVAILTRAELLALLRRAQRVGIGSDVAAHMSETLAELFTARPVCTCGARQHAGCFYPRDTKPFYSEPRPEES